MAFKLPKNSLFAVLLRSPWWVSFVVAGVLSLLAMVLLPEAYRAVGALSSFPFVVIGVMALRRQWSLPRPGEIALMGERVGAMTWMEFSPVAREALGGIDRVVREVTAGGADYEVHTPVGRQLVSARRWKSARLGVEVLREFKAACDAAGAASGIFICLGEVTEPAARFASASAIELWGAAELAVRLRGRLPERNAQATR